jgi:hypothetical protein
MGLPRFLDDVVPQSKEMWRLGMNSEFKLKDVLRWALDVIEDLVSIAIAAALLIYGWLVDQEVVKNTPLVLSTIIGILIIMAIGNLRDRRNRFRQMQETVEQTLQEVEGNKIYEVAGADKFFSEGRHEFHNKMIPIASSIAISGITLSGTVGRILDPLKDRLRAGAQVRVMMLDSTADDALRQLVKCSWSKKAKVEKYVAMLENSSDLLKDIGSESGLVGSFEIGYLPFVPSVGITLIESEHKSDTALVEIHHQLRKCSRGFQVDSSEDPESFQLYREQFELMWKECRTEKIVG